MIRLDLTSDKKIQERFPFPKGDRVAINVFERFTHRDFSKIEEMLDRFALDFSVSAERKWSRMRIEFSRLKTIYELLEGCEHYLSQDMMDIVEFLLLSQWHSEILKMRKDCLGLFDEVENPWELREFMMELRTLKLKLKKLLDQLEEASCI